MAGEYSGLFCLFQVTSQQAMPAVELILWPYAGRKPNLNPYLLLNIAPNPA